MIQRVTYWDLEDLEKREVENTFMVRLGKSWDRSIQVGSLSMCATHGLLPAAHCPPWAVP